MIYASCRKELTANLPGIHNMFKASYINELEYGAFYTLCTGKIYNPMEEARMLVSRMLFMYMSIWSI